MSDDLDYHDKRITDALAEWEKSLISPDVQPNLDYLTYQPARKFIKSELIELQIALHRCDSPKRVKQYEAKQQEHQKKLRELETLLRERSAAPLSTATVELSSPTPPESTSPTKPITPIKPLSAGVNQPSNQPSAWKTLMQAGEVQQDTLASLHRSQCLVQRSEEHAIEAAKGLQQQRETLLEVDRELDRMQSHLRRVRRELQWFVRSLASDKFFMTTLCLLILALCFLVGYKIYGAVVRHSDGVPSNTTAMV